MADYRRWYVAGGTYFFTIVTYRRRPLFGDPANVERLRQAIRSVQRDQPFHIHAAVVLPDHIHFLWSLPRGDANYSKRIGRMKVEFTKSLYGGDRERPMASRGASTTPSRRKHRESDIWQRRFWEHTIRDEHEFERSFDYIHYNPVKHEHAACPHLWIASSFHRWVEREVYDLRWGCRCDDRNPGRFDFSDIQDITGEPE
jgi:putative transposase